MRHLENVNGIDCFGEASWTGHANGSVLACQKCGNIKYLQGYKDWDPIAGWSVYRLTPQGSATLPSSYQSFATVHSGNYVIGNTFQDSFDGWHSISKPDEPIKLPMCECGAHAIGIKNYSIGHASYCPVKST